MLKKVKCMFGYHDYVVIKSLSMQCQKLQCKRCDKYFAVNHSLRAILPWDKEVESFYSNFGKLLREEPYPMDPDLAISCEPDYDHNDGPQ